MPHWLIALGIFSCALTIPSFAARTISVKDTLHSLNRPLMEGKLYVHPHELLIFNQGIFLSLEGHLLPVNTLGFDTNGIYCDWSEGANTLWECSKCGFLNKEVYYKCINCQWDRRNDDAS